MNPHRSALEHHLVLFSRRELIVGSHRYLALAQRVFERSARNYPSAYVSSPQLGILMNRMMNLQITWRVAVLVELSVRLYKKMGRERKGTRVYIASVYMKSWGVYQPINQAFI